MSINPPDIELSPQQRRQIAERTGNPWPVVLTDLLSNGAPDLTRSNGNAASMTLADALAQDRLIGCIEGRPSDLSTNPKYNEAFGRDLQPGAG